MSDPIVAYTTSHGMMLVGDSEATLRSPAVEPYRGRVQLIMTSPPFALQRQKAYGNRTGDEYIE